MANKTLPITTEDRKAKRDELFEALSKESDRGLVMVSAAFLDEALEGLLRSRFTVENKKPKSVIDSLFNSFGPLSTYSAKIKTAFAIDLIEKWMFHDLDALRKLRNEFAHTIRPAKFDADEVMKITTKFIGADNAVAALEKQKKPQKKTNKTLNNNNIADRERLRTIMTVSYIGALVYFKTEILLSELPLESKQKILSDANKKET